MLGCAGKREVHDSRHQGQRMVPQRRPPARVQKRLSVFRLDVVRARPLHCGQDCDYGTIIVVAHKTPENVFQEDPKLLMWYDQAGEDS